MPYLADRVQDTTSSTGTGPLVLDNAPPLGFRAFATAFPTGARVAYCIVNTNGEWETGKGQFNGSTGLTREEVRASSNSNNLVAFTSGSKQVFVTASAEILENSGTGMMLAARTGLMCLP